MCHIFLCLMKKTTYINSQVSVGLFFLLSVFCILYTTVQKKTGRGEGFIFSCMFSENDHVEFQCELQDAQNYVKMFVLLHTFKVYEYFV
jgi:hypothetical protein